jgi:hypothetical protein
MWALVSAPVTTMTPARPLLARRRAQSWAEPTGSRSSPSWPSTIEAPASSPACTTPSITSVE